MVDWLVSNERFPFSNCATFVILKWFLLFFYNKIIKLPNFLLSALESFNKTLLDIKNLRYRYEFLVKYFKGNPYSIGIFLRLFKFFLRGCTRNRKPFIHAPHQLLKEIEF